MDELPINELNQLSETTKSLTNTSLELAQAASDYGALKVIFGVFMVIVILTILTIVVSYIFSLKKLNNINNASNKVLKYFDNMSKKTIGKEESQSLIRESLNRCKALTKYYILRIKYENHINNKELTKQKIEKIVENSFAELNSFLSKFIYNDTALSIVIDLEDSKPLMMMIENLVYQDKDNFTISNMDQTVELFFDGLKLEYTKKLD